MSSFDYQQTTVGGQTSCIKIIGTFTVLCYGTGELKVIGVFDLQLKHYLGIIMGFYYKLSIVVYWELSASFGNRKGGIISRWRGGG